MKKNMFLLAILYINFICTSYNTPKRDIWIDYPNRIYVPQYCKGEKVKFEIELKTDSRREIALFDFKLPDSNYTILHNNISVLEDTIFLNKKNPIYLNVTYDIVKKEKSNMLSFKTSSDLDKLIKIPIIYKSLSVSSSMIRDSEEVVIDLSKNCTNEMFVHFPIGGTTNSVVIYKKNEKIKRPYKSLSYVMSTEPEYRNFKTQDIGEYDVEFYSCHWSGKFPLIIK